MPTPVQIFGYGESPTANLGACTITIHTSNKQAQMATCQVTDTRGYLILGRTTAQQVGYIGFAVVTPPAFTCVPQVHTRVNALHPNLDEVKSPTCEVMNDAVILNGERETVYLLQSSTCCENLKMCSKALVNCQEGNTTLNSNLMLHSYKTHPGQCRKRRKRPIKMS